MKITDILCHKLLNRTLTIANALDCVSNTKVLLAELREDGWESPIEEVISFCLKHEVDIPDMNQKKGKNSRNTWAAAIAGEIEMLLLLLTFISLAATMLQPAVLAAPPPSIGMPGCNTTCGNVTVPYPFGMGPSRCYLPEFNLACDNGNLSLPSTTGGSLSGKMQVVGIFLENSTVRVMTLSQGTENITSSSGRLLRWRLGKKDGPYSLAASNEFIVTGCNVDATLVDGRSGRNVSSCASCMGDNIPWGENATARCSLGTCSAPIASTGAAAYDVKLRPVVDVHDGVLPPLPVHALIAEKGWLGVNHAFNLLVGFEQFYPTVLDWASATQDVCKSAHSVRKHSARGYTCYCQRGYEGNPYLTNGCQDINECLLPDLHPCYGVCTNTFGSFDCRCPRGFKGNVMIPDGCVKSVNTGLIIGTSVASAPFSILLAFGAFLIVRKVNHQKEKRMKQKFFDQNRGQLLEQLISHRSDIAERMIIPLQELEKATNNFDQTRKLGGGGHGTVYKGILSDQHVVAIKRSKIVVKREIDEFINEVAILSQINHRNIVKLLGCCLETEVPLLAYEFISNGTLSDYLHKEPRSPIPWEDRLRIAAELGKALAYLHSGIYVPIIHRDIKSANILLDDSLTIKVADFGASRYIPSDGTGITTVVQGTIGYLDPMYYYSGRLTEKSDVYSFGVILVELLTRKGPITYRSSEGDGLVTHFIELLAEGNLVEILDPQVVDEGGSQVEDVASLAASCVKIKAEERPSMRQVEMTLEGLRAPKEHAHDDLIAKRVEDSCFDMSIEEVSFTLSGSYPRYFL
ncbi:unnamed protein product [Alopecurus aequalis]